LDLRSVFLSDGGSLTWLVVSVLEASYTSELPGKRDVIMRINAFTCVSLKHIKQIFGWQA